MEKKKINNNGYEYVDLNLPSGTLWATCNIGASKPSESGLYFQWGDTQGYTKEQIGKGDEQKKFAKDWSDYKMNPSRDGVTFTKYTSKGDILEPEDDAAHVYMGGDWYMPTPKQIWELIENTTTTWMTYDRNGVGGIEFTSKRDISKSIFIPASGCVRDGCIRFYRNDGYIWSSMLSKNNVGDGQHLDLTYEGINLYGNYRSFGFPVRGVIDSSKENKDRHLNLNEAIKNEIKNNFQVKVTKDIEGKVEVKLLYDDEVISSDMC